MRSNMQVRQREPEKERSQRVPEEVGLHEGVGKSALSAKGGLKEARKRVLRIAVVVRGAGRD